MNTPVNFEIAKLLKEKEFDKKVFRYFDIHYETPNDIYSLGSFENWNVQLNLISAPTIAEVVMWLYNKHGVWIWVERYSSMFRPYAEELGDERFGKWEGHKYDTPTEAYSQAIIYTLKNLIL